MLEKGPEFEKALKENLKENLETELESLRESLAEMELARQVGQHGTDESNSKAHEIELKIKKIEEQLKGM